MIASIMDTQLSIQNYSQATDIKTLTNALRQLGFSIDINDGKAIITPPLNLNSEITCNITDSATGFRFLLARLAAAQKGKYLLHASHQLQKRPMQPLLNALRTLGASIDSQRFPYVINAQKLSGGKILVDTCLSSQFTSALLLIAPLCKESLQLDLTGSRVSWNYVMMTIALMRKFSIKVTVLNDSIIINAPQKPAALTEISIEPDYSAAAYFWAMAASHDLSVSINGSRIDSTQPDAKFPEILEQMGATITDLDSNTIVTRNKLKGIEVNMSQMPDQVPTLAVLALLATTPTKITGVEHLQYKESNRIKALLTEFQRINAKANYKNGILTINPLNANPGAVTITTHHDHRLAMAFSILKLHYPQIRIDNPSVVNKSFPSFWEQFQIIKDIE